MSGWVEILFTYDEVEARIVKELLEAEGISAIIESEKISPYPVNIGRIGEVRVMIKEEDLAKAKDVLRAMNDLLSEEGDN